MNEDMMKLYRNSKGNFYPEWCKTGPTKEFAKKFPSPRPNVAEQRQEQDHLAAERKRKFGHHFYREMR